MTKSKAECINTARESLNLFTGDELETYIKQVLSESRRLQKEGHPSPIQQASKIINEQQGQELLSDSARIARDAGKFDLIEHRMNDGIDSWAFLDKTRKNTDYNLETAGNASSQLLHDRAWGDFEKEHFNALEKGEIDDFIYDVADGAQHHDSVIMKIGTALREYIDPRNAMLIRSDAMKPSQMNKDRFFRNTYDPSKMVKMGKELWVKRHKELIDVKGTFENTRAMDENGQIIDSVVDEMIGNTYDNIIQGNGPLFTKSTVSKDIDRIERSRHMFYKYKDWKSWGLANQEYGQGDLLSAWLMDINSSGKQIGIAEIFGTQPQRMWLKMREIQVNRAPPNVFGKQKLNQADSLFNQILGVNKGPYDPTLANVGASIRNISTMARLGKLVLRSVPDISNVGGASMRAGMGYWGSLFDSLTHVFGLMPDESRVEISKIMSNSLNVHKGTVSRHVDTAGVGNAINRWTNKYFYRLGVNAWDNGNKLSAMSPIMKGYGRQSSKSFSFLNDQQQAYLRRFNISEIEWDGLRQNTERGMFSTDNVKNMSDTELRKLWQEGDRIGSLSNYRSDLYRKVFAMFDAAHEFSVLNPTAYSRMWSTFNTRAGTLEGEAVRMIMQFKSYPIQYMRRVFMGIQDFDSYQAKMMYATNMMLGTVMLTQLGDMLNAIASGLTPPNPANMNRREQAAYYGKMVVGGFGVLGTILNDGTTTKELVGSLVGTPSIRFIGDPVLSAISLAKGDLKSAQRDIKDWANVANPIGTFPVISPYIDAILGNKVYLEPGQQPLY
jgi:hypothetical protein